MNLYQKNSNGNDSGHQDEPILELDKWDTIIDPWLSIEDILARKKKIRLSSKYSEKRYIP